MDLVTLLVKETLRLNKMFALCRNSLRLTTFARFPPAHWAKLEMASRWSKLDVKDCGNLLVFINF